MARYARLTGCFCLEDAMIHVSPRAHGLPDHLPPGSVLAWDQDGVMGLSRTVLDPACLDAELEDRWGRLPHEAGFGVPPVELVSDPRDDVLMLEVPDAPDELPELEAA